MADISPRLHTRVLNFRHHLSTIHAFVCRCQPKSMPVVSSRKGRRIASKACDICRDRKVQCVFENEGSLSCRRCVDNKVACTFLKGRKARGPPSRYVLECKIVSSHRAHSYNSRTRPSHNLPVGDFFRGLLHYYRLELVHLVPNSIVLVSTFIHLCEAFLGISSNFLLWRYFFQVKSTGKHTGVVGSVMFCLRSKLKPQWIDMEVPDSNTKWRSDWFYVADQKPVLPKRTGFRPEKVSEWTLELSSREAESIQELLNNIADLKEAPW